MMLTPRPQRGIVAVLVTIALLVLLAIAGLALDSGRMVLNKSQLQSTVDSAALAAAKVLNETGSRAEAQTVAADIFAQNAEELSGVLTDATMLPLEYSDTLMGLMPGGDRGEGRHYVRVVAGNFSIWTSFSRVVGVPELAAAASAVAGPSAPLQIRGACDVVPLMVCIDRVNGTKANGWNVLDSTKVTPLKIAQPDSFAPGNTGLICLEGGNCGANKIREWLRQGGCIPPSGYLDTKPGTVTGPTGQGLSTRFTASGLPDWPPDVITDQVGLPALTMLKGNAEDAFFCLDGTPDKCRTVGDKVNDIDDVHLNYQDYSERLAAGRSEWDEPDRGRAERRVVALPVVDCGPDPNGRETVEVKDLACFYLLQDIIRVAGNPAYVLGQYTNEPCAASGTPGTTPGSGTGTGVFKIVLHNDPNSDSS